MLPVFIWSSSHWLVPPHTVRGGSSLKHCLWKTPPAPLEETWSSAVRGLAYRQRHESLRVHCCFVLEFFIQLHSSIHPVAVQSLSHVRLFVTPWTAARQGSLSFTISRTLLRLMFIVMLSNHLSLCRPLPLWLSIFPTISVFCNESDTHLTST